MRRCGNVCIYLPVVFGMGMAFAVNGLPDGEVIFDVHKDMAAQPVYLLNQGDCEQKPFDRADYLQIKADTDPYSKLYWEFRFAEPPVASGDSFVLEVVYYDIGAGVIQPELLVDDAFNGIWSGPNRQQAYTRLNTKKERSAFFAFSMPGSFDKDSRHSHLRIAGLQYLRLLKIHPPMDDTAWKTVAATVPTEVTPMITLARDMDLVTTAGITVHGNGFSSLQSDLDNLHNYAPLAKVLGMNAIEAYMRWNVIEPEQEGVFDFSYYDAVVAKLQSYGLQWFPLLIVGSAYALPDWFLGSEEDKGFVCLEHGISNPIQSIWSPYHERHVTRVLQAFGKHYEKGGSLRGVRLGPSGNYGESQYPAGGNWPPKSGSMHIHIGWWAGDPYGVENFRQTMAERYGGIEALNAAWGKNYASFGDVEIILPQQIISRRQRIDFASWYTDSMTKWCDWWVREARKAMPNTPLYQSAGGWGFVEAGTSYSGQAKSMQQVQGGIRLTNETDSFEQNINATRLAMTAARHYGIMTGSEPASSHTARGIAGRLFALATSNSDHFFTYQGNLFNDQTAIDQWLKYLPIMEHRRHPLVEVAVYYPETMNQLEDAAFRHLYAWGFNPRAAAIRCVIEIDYMDEQLIRDGFLDKYKALVFCWGNVIEADVLAKIDSWMRSGGTVLYPSFPRGALETVEGDATVFARWSKGDTGAGGFRRFQGDMEPYDLYGGFVRKQLREMNSLDVLTKKVLQIEHTPQVFMSVGENGDLMILNYEDVPQTLHINSVQTIEVPSYGIKRLAPGEW